MSKTYEEIYDMTAHHMGIKGRTWQKTPVDGKQWWLVFEYLDWKYNNCAFTNLAFSRWLEDLERA